MSTFITMYAKKHGLAVRDATEPLMVELEQKDIRSAKPRDPRCCAFAKAIKRQEHDVKKAWFFRSTAWLETDKELVRYLLPPSAMREIVAFDRGGRMEPGAFQLSPPSGTQRLGEAGKRAPSKRSSKGGGVSRRLLHHATGIRTLKLPRGVVP